MIVYVSVGNSDDRLSQLHWAEFVDEVADVLSDVEIELHGAWFSLPDARWQNACWCVEIDDRDAADTKDRLAVLAERYQQDSIAWAVAETEFVKPAR